MTVAGGVSAGSSNSLTYLAIAVYLRCRRRLRPRAAVGRRDGDGDGDGARRKGEGGGMAAPRAGQGGTGWGGDSGVGQSRSREDQRKEQGFHGWVWVEGPLFRRRATHLSFGRLVEKGAFLDMGGL